MKKRFPTLARRERGKRCSVFLNSKRKYRFICIAFVFCLSAVIASPAQTLTTLASFNGANGANPYFMSLVQGSDGNLYGTTFDGGANSCGSVSCGTVFKITPTGTLTTLYSFSGPDGEYPYAGLVQGTDGNFYGTTWEGGANGNYGTVFKITPTGALTRLYSFCMLNGCADGVEPVAGLVQATDGNFYGTTEFDGANGAGTVFKVTPTGTLTTLYSFCALTGCADGTAPFAAMVQATDGNFYGTTGHGGANGDYGTVFKITPTGTLTTLHSFGGPDGHEPAGELVKAADGNFYGTTFQGGANSCGSGTCGTIFKITSTGTLNTLYSFSGPDGANPIAGLVQATDGDFYGTTTDGGSNNHGTVFKITSTGTLNTLYSFSGPDGANPKGGLVQATDGNFYGTTTDGGSNNDGTVFRLSTTTNYTLTVSLSGDGSVTSTDGFITCPGMCSHLYPSNTPVSLNATPASGSIFSGWSGACTGTGTCNLTMTQNLSVTAVFSSNALLRVSTNGSGTVSSTDGDINCPGVCGYSYLINTPATLNATPAQGWSFAGWSGACSGNGLCNVTMTQDLSVTATFTQNQGYYSLTVSTSGSGTVTSTDGFITCPGTCSHTYQANSQAALNASPGQGGTFSGWSGACTGTGSCNVTMTQNLSVTATFSGQQDMVLHSFGSSGNDGQNPLGSLISDSAGNLYGTTSVGGGMNGKGTVFEVSNGAETILHIFGNGNDGQNPLGTLIFDSVGNLYGTTSAGGTFGNGTVFELSPNGTETVLYNFGNGGDGQNPQAGLVFDSSGNLYGTTVNGGANGNGTAFEVSPNGTGGWTETVLYNFGNGSSDGLNPYAGLVFDNSGNMYGTTANGGPNSAGTVFELVPFDAPRCCREILVYGFGGSGDGQNPHAGLIFDGSGNLYGTTVNGGANRDGTAFEVSPNGGGGWAETVLYSFGNSSSDGLNPYAGLVFDNFGNLYGTTKYGGLHSAGTVFELAPFSSANPRCCRELPVYNFGNAPDGQNPNAGVIFGTSGNLYGTTVNGGAYGGGTVFGIAPGKVQFVTAMPCRLVDTRPEHGGSGPIQGRTFQSFPIPQEGGCNIPTSAAAYSLNVSVVPQGPLGYLTIWPTGENQPPVSTLNSIDGRIKADAAIVPAGAGGAVSIYVTNTTNVVLDINGYFAAASGSTLAFYPLPPCRVADTRHSTYPPGLGPPYLTGHAERQFPILNATSCNTPSSAAAYSLNFSVVPHGGLGYLTVWPTGQSQPLVSTLNDLPGTIIANAAIVPAGTGGEVSVYPSSDTDLVIDINGYFAPAGPGGLSLYAVAPCRVIDTRQIGPPFSGTLNPPVDVVGSFCGPPATAQAYVFNATVVPTGALGYLTLWPDGATQPLVSTLNALDGSITNNMAIVPSTNGKVDAYASGITQLILDISSYFAP
jgi:uncharacterized repeat protein (TIGR02543 family)